MMTLLWFIFGCSNKGATCQSEVSVALMDCVQSVSNDIRQCYEEGGTDCTDADFSEILEPLASAAVDSCETPLFGLEQESFVERVEKTCVSDAQSLSWRVFGGPQAAVWNETDSENHSCLSSAHEIGVTYSYDRFTTMNDCLAGECSQQSINPSLTSLRQDALSQLSTSCTDLEGLIALDPPTFLDRIEHQTDCMISTTHENVKGLNLSCGPSNTDFSMNRGSWQQIIVDGDKWGTLCGDGSEFAFHVKFAPEGEPLDNIFIGLQGGGVCVFESDCSSKLASSPGLFNAQDDVPYEFAIISDDPDISPFANWTKVFVPYCNQDVFAGGGVTEDLGSMQLPRYGAENLRAAVQMVRDVIWEEMDSSGDGYRPDQVQSFIGGWSAGAYGTIYNYHWFLDDLKWANTTAFPDAGMALHNGETLGVLGLGLLKIPSWGAQKNLPPYCFQGECAVGPILYEALSQRLKRTPFQQILITSNPKDSIQMGDSYFSELDFWVNTMRQSYCDTKDLPGINYYLTSYSISDIHCVTVRPDLWLESVDGVVMKDWFTRAITDPDSIQSRVEEASFVNDIDGVEPYPCDVPE